MAKLGQYLAQCKRGHLREGDNLLITPSGQRVCRKCMKIRWLAYEKSEQGQLKRKEISDRYRENNTEKIRERMVARIKKARDYVTFMKTNPCLDCGSSFPPCAMDFDHIRGIKKDDLSGMCDSGYIIEALKAEIDKCELVCANCHRIRTYKRKHSDGS